MIAEAAQQEMSEPVLRLAALLPATVESVLVKRGIDPDSLDEVKAAIASVGAPFTPEDAVEYAFKGANTNPPHTVGRFGNGHYPVYYSALEEETCLAEVRYHKSLAFERQLSGQLPYPRYYQIIACDFSGSAMMLVGFEQQHPELVSPTEAGYPFCQNVAQWSMAQGASALHTASARRTGGTCVPVFSRACLTNARASVRFRFATEAGAVTHERLPSP